jgi:hypothetical protein
VAKDSCGSHVGGALPHHPSTPEAVPARVSKGHRAGRRPIARNLDRATDVVPGGRAGCLPLDEQFVLVDALERPVDLGGVSVQAQPARPRDADGRRHDVGRRSEAVATMVCALWELQLPPV